jgi:hypothetical protein
MQIVVHHLTRMQAGCMCVAGIDLETGLPVRPVLDRQMTVDMLSVHGGPFDIGRLIDLGKTRFVGRVPEVEDQLFDAGAARHIGDMPATEFRTLVEKHAEEKLGVIFGPDLQRVGTTCVIAETYGVRSLGCYPVQVGRLFVEDSCARPRIRFSWEVGEYKFTVPVTDIRLYGEDHVTPCRTTVERVAQQLPATERLVVSVGLSRPYRKAAGDPSRHWLQINNFHLPDNPCWTLAEALGK